MVANPRKVRLIAQSDLKTDSFDAELLARLGRFDLKLLSPIRHRGEQTQQDLALIRARDGLVRARTQLINRAHNRELKDSKQKPYKWDFFERIA